MNFAHQELLWLALLALPELALGFRRMPILRASLQDLAGPARRARAGRAFATFSGIGSVSAALLVVAAALAMAGPSWGERGAPVERHGLEAAVVLDVSRSMVAVDQKTTRLETAKALISSLLRGSGTEDEGLSFSLIATKGASVLLVPMTEDTFAFEEALDYATPDTTSAAGTDLESGIREGLSSFTHSGAEGRMLFLFSDGGELSGSSRRAIEDAAAAQVRLVVVGVGGDTPVHVPGPDGVPLATSKGPVKSARDAPRLKALAALAGGPYLDASDPQTRAALAAELKAARRGGTRIEYRRVDRSGLFALLALAFLVSTILAKLLSIRGART